MPIWSSICILFTIKRNKNTANLHNAIMVPSHNICWPTTTDGQLLVRIYIYMIITVKNYERRNVQPSTSFVCMHDTIQYSVNVQTHQGTNKGRGKSHITNTGNNVQYKQRNDNSLARKH